MLNEASVGYVSFSNFLFFFYNSAEMKSKVDFTVRCRCTAGLLYIMYRYDIVYGIFILIEYSNDSILSG